MCRENKFVIYFMGLKNCGVWEECFREAGVDVDWSIIPQ